MISLEDPRCELRVVTAIDEWIHLRQSCRPHTGNLGSDPVEADMFDCDSSGNVHVAMLPRETLHLPLAFLTLLPFSGSTNRRQSSRLLPSGTTRSKSSVDREERKGEEKEKDIGGGNGNDTGPGYQQDDEPSRHVEIRIISCTHGHVIAVIRVNIFPRPFIIHRTLRFFEPENAIMRRRIQLVTNNSSHSAHNGYISTGGKCIRCIEMDGTEPIRGNTRQRAQTRGNTQTGSKVVVEWGPTQDPASIASDGNGKERRRDSLDVILRYKCGDFPDMGSFFLLVYDDSYQCQLSEVSSYHFI